MPTSALVITLDHREDWRDAALTELAGDPRLTLGTLQGPRLPVVAETATLAEGDRLVADELPLVPGVQFVDVVLVDFSDVENFDELPRRRGRRGREGLGKKQERDS